MGSVSESAEKPIAARPPRRRRRRVAVRLALAAALAGFVFHGAQVIDPDVRALAAALGEATHAVVLPEDVRWEPSVGAAADLIFGRNVLFLGRPTAGAPRDVYRARVRLTWEGRPIGIFSTSNLTATPLGDDHALVVQGTHAAFATAAFGQEQSVSLLDLAPAPKSDASTGDAAMRWLTNLQSTGDGKGVRRVDVTLDPPGRSVGLAMVGRSLEVQVADERSVKSARFDVEAPEASAATEGAARFKVEPVDTPPKKLVHWAVDTVRAVPWIGPAPIAWLEERFFALRDTARQTAFGLSGAKDEVRSDAQAIESAPILDSSALASREDAAWPPANVQSIWKTPEPGEGEWVAAKIPWVKRLDVPGAPPAFVRTFVRPDEQRPYAKVLLVAWDTRRLDLSMEAGSEDPKPLVGPTGPGRLPRDPAVSSRVVAAFNGAFKTEHGFHGMMVQKRVLLPPVPGTATVIVTKDGRAGLGTWGAPKEVTGLKGVPDDDIVSLRQNLDALVDRGVVNPSKRSLWGFTLPGTSMQTERSGLCVTAAGHLVYAWGDDVSGITLAKGMKLAGCDYGMHLDMNPHHTGFLFANIDDLKAKRYRTELLSSDMEIPNDRYLEHSAKDFFYLTVREPTPPPLTIDKTPVAWAAAPGAQPPPAWFPGIFEASAVVQGHAVTLTEIEPGRARFRVRGGSGEPDAGAGRAVASRLDERDATRVLFALGMGVAHDKRPRGLANAGRALAPVRGVEGTALLVATDGALTIKRGEAVALSEGVDYAELPLLFDGAASFTHGPAGDEVRAALGTSEQGRVVVARGRGASDGALTSALRAAGATRAVLLDRGEGVRGTFDRAQTASPPRGTYEETVLYGVAEAMRPRAFRFEAEVAAPRSP